MTTALDHLVGTHALACVLDASEFGSVTVRHVFMTTFTEALASPHPRCGQGSCARTPDPCTTLT
jgi:hypothetical protein